MLPSQTGDRVAKDLFIPSLIALHYHGTGVLASNKKTESFHLTFNLLIKLLDKVKMKNYSSW
jgi:hypothetical protein